MEMRFLSQSACMLFLSSLPIFAHEVTLFPEYQSGTVQLTAHYGDPGSYEEITKIKLLSLDQIAPDGSRSSVLASTIASADRKSLIATSALPALKNGSVIFASHYDNGFFVHAADGHPIATTLADYPAAHDSAHYFKFSKAILATGQKHDGYDRVLGDKLELVARTDPSAQDANELVLEVRFANKPLANAEIEIGDAATANRIPSRISDANGIVRIPLDHAGWYRLAVTHRSPSAYPSLFAEDDLTASLVFER